MTFMHYTFQIVMMAIGFGVGYGILVAANDQEGTTKNVGQALAWILIVMTVILEYMVATLQ